MTIKDLRERWRTPEGAALAQHVLLALVDRYPMPDGLSRHEGRVDLRGFALAALAQSPAAIVDGHRLATLDGVAKIHSGRWVGLDLSHASLPSLRFHSSTIRDCRFDKASCQDWRGWDTEIADSSFTGADLRHSALLTWGDERGNTWRRVVFDNADLRECALWGGLLEDCSLAGTRLDGNDFRQVAIRGCRFTGQMKDVTFDGRRIPDWPPPAPIVDTDFSEAKFDDVWFNGSHIQNVALPEGAYVVPNFPVVAAQVSESLKDDDSTEARVLRMELEATLRSPGDPDSVGVLNRDDYVRSSGEALADFVERAFREAAEQVG